MKANWSLVLNIVLLFGVVLAIARLLLLRKKETKSSEHMNDINFNDVDDIIAVRKLEDSAIEEDIDIQLSPLKRSPVKKEDNQESLETQARNETTDFQVDNRKTLMMFLSSKEQQEFSGYELLQSLLSAGLRFGEGDIFHKYQKSNGQGAVLFSLAAATARGTFDLQTMGSYSVRGLCVYMYLSGYSNIDSERFTLMHDTAKSLAEDLDANLLDDRQNIFSASSLERYNSYINTVEEESLEP